MANTLDIAKAFGNRATGWEKGFGDIAGGGRHYGLVSPGVLLGLGFQAVGLLDRLGKNRGNMVTYQRDMGARVFGLAMHDYTNISDRKGLPNVSGQEWRPHWRDGERRMTGTQFNSYLRNAHLVYETGAMDIGRGNDIALQQQWKLQAQRFEGIHAMDPMTGVLAMYSVPHIADLAFRTMTFMAKSDGQGSPASVVHADFRKRRELLDDDPLMWRIEHASDRIAEELTIASNGLIALDPTVRESGLPFFKLDPGAPQDMGRAALQIFAAGYLKAADKRDPGLAGMLSDVAYCGWGMMRVGPQRYVDEKSATDLLETQWGIGLNIDPVSLHTNPKVWQDAVETLVKQVP